MGLSRSFEGVNLLQTIASVNWLPVGARRDERPVDAPVGISARHSPVSPPSWHPRWRPHTTVAERTALLSGMEAARQRL